MAGKPKSLADVFPKDMEKEEPDGDEAEESDSDMPPDFEAAYAEYDDSPSAETFWRAVKACKG